MIIRLEPIPLTKVWGGDKLSNVYNFSLSKIGEIWGISAHKSNSNKISNGPFKGLTFRELYTKHREYFGHYPKDEFPLLLKIIDAKEDLSIQVHPNNEYARTHEDSFGKDECWYILDANEKSRIQIGHTAKNKKEMQNAFINNKLEEILEYRSIGVGDYYYIPSGKVHAICRNTTLLEVSQSSDITYRLYDYNRLDNGKYRKLHLENALANITFPDTNLETQPNEKYFSFNILSIIDETIVADKHGDYIYIIEGEGYINSEKVYKSQFIVLTSESEYKIRGNIKIALVRITI